MAEEVQVVLALLALAAVACVVLLTVVWQRQAKMNNRLTHVENELGVDDAERAQVEDTVPRRRPREETVRGKLHTVEQKTGSHARRLVRLNRLR